MFNPSRDEVRQFFFSAWSKHLARSPLVGLETTAVDVMLAHPEYHTTLATPQDSAMRDYGVEDGRENPFLHLSLHLAIEEQLGIDQPPGIRAEFSRLEARSSDRHAALHVILECLGETVWAAQRNASPPDSDAYLDCIRRR